MPLLHLEALPPRTTKGEILHLLIGEGGIGRAHVGKIELHGSAAAIEVPSSWERRLARALDGIAFKGRSLRAWAAGAEAVSASAEDHFRRVARLLELESDAEARQTLERFRDLPAADAGSGSAGPARRPGRRATGAAADGARPSGRTSTRPGRGLIGIIQNSWRGSKLCGAHRRPRQSYKYSA
jgi:hypothetical protein